MVVAVVFAPAAIVTAILWMRLTWLAPERAVFADAPSIIIEREPLTPRWLAIVTDGITDTARDDADISPFFHDVERRGLGGDVVATTSPRERSFSGTAPIVWATGGSVPPRRIVLRHRPSEPWRGEDVFRLFHERGLRVALLGRSNWTRLFAESSRWRHGSAGRGHHERESSPRPLDALDPADAETIERALDVMTNEAWHAMVVHLRTPADIAATHGTRLRTARGDVVRPYGQSVYLADLASRRLVAHAGSNTTVFLLTAPIAGVSDVSARFAADGPGLHRRKDRCEIRDVDWAATWCRLFGLRAPIGSSGTVASFVDVGGAGISTTRNDDADKASDPSRENRTRETNSVTSSSQSFVIVVVMLVLATVSGIASRSTMRMMQGHRRHLADVIMVVVPYLLTFIVMVAFGDARRWATESIAGVATNTTTSSLRFAMLLPMVTAAGLALLVRSPMHAAVIGAVATDVVVVGLAAAFVGTMGAPAIESVGRAELLIGIGVGTGLAAVTTGLVALLRKAVSRARSPRRTGE